MEGMMKIRLINQGEFVNLKEIWNGLLQESSNNEFFLTWEWVYTWWQVYGKNKELFILCIKDDSDNLIGIAPYYIKKDRLFNIFNIKKILFLGVGENVCPEYLNVIVKNGFEEKVTDCIIEHLLANKKIWHSIRLSDISEKHTITDFIFNKAQEKNLFVAKEKVKTPCVSISLPKTWENLCSRLSSKFRYNMKWGRKKLTEIPGSSIKVFFGNHYPLYSLDSLFELHNKRMLQKGKKGKFKYQDYRNFHIGLIARIPDYRAISVLEVNNKPIGMIYGFYYNNKIYIYQTGFDPASEYKKYSIGQILYSYMIEKAIALGCQEFDFLRGGEEHKYKWSAVEKRKEAIIVFNTYMWQGRLMQLRYKIRKIIKSILKILKND